MRSEYSFETVRILNRHKISPDLHWRLQILEIVYKAANLELYKILTEVDTLYVAAVAEICEKNGTDDDYDAYVDMVKLAINSKRGKEKYEI